MKEGLIRMPLSHNGDQGAPEHRLGLGGIGDARERGERRQFNISQV